MTVGAVIVPDGVKEALADATGRTAVRRIVDSAWAGGALPIVVVAADPDGRIAQALEGSPATIVDPARASGVKTYRLGAEAAGGAVQETTAVLLWPGRMTWADPETVTSLIEAHGRAAQQVTRPRRAGESGWPVLLPLDLLETVLGSEVALDDMPDYAGPPEPVGGPPPEWGAAAADTPESELGDPA